MAQYLTLVKNIFRCGFRSAAKKDNGMKLAVMALLVFTMFGFGIILFAPMGLSLGGIAKANGLEKEIFAIALTTINVFLLIFGSIYLLSIMYFSKDTEFYMSQPIKSTTIFLAKLTAVYLLLLVFTAYFILFFGVVFGVSAGLGAKYFIMLLLIILLAPLPALFLATLISFPLMAIVNFLKRHRVLSLILSILLAITVFVSYAIFYTSIFKPKDNVEDPNASQEQVEQTDDEIHKLPENLVQSIKKGSKYAIPFYNISALATKSDNLPVDITVTALSYLAMMALILVIAGVLYRRGISKGLEASGAYYGGKSGKIVDKDMLIQTPKQAVIKKEIKNVLRTPMLVIQLIMATLSVILVLIIFSSVISTIRDVMIKSFGEEFGKQLSETIALVMCVFLGTTLLSSSNFLASSAISREGKNFYLMKTLPISPLEQIEVKLKFSLVAPMIANLLMVIVAVVLKVLVWYDAIGLFIVNALLIYAITNWQVAADVKRPKLDWDNVAQVIQNNPNALMSLLFCFLLGLGYAGLVFLTLFLMSWQLIIVKLLMWGVLIGITGVIAYFMRKKYLKNIVLHFNEIE